MFEEKTEMTITTQKTSDRYMNNRNAMSDWVNEILSNSTLTKDTSSAGSIEHLKAIDDDKDDELALDNHNCKDKLIISDKPKILPKPALPPKPQNATLTKKKSLDRENVPLLPSKKPTDPAEMPLRDRLALFEKNKGTALIPKAPLSMSVAIRPHPSNRKNVLEKTYCEVIDGAPAITAGKFVALDLYSRLDESIHDKQTCTILESTLLYKNVR